MADVLIVDWHMQPLDGLDFVRLVRTASDSPNPYVPIIMLTGYTEYARVVEARDAGINEFLAKPISAKSLYLRFAAIIDNPRPFIRTKKYFGPDRRRQELGPPLPHLLHLQVGVEPLFGQGDANDPARRGQPEMKQCSHGAALYQRTPALPCVTASWRGIP